MVPGANRNFAIFDPLDFLAAVTCHIPNRGDHLARYYGYYSSVQRGRRRRQGPSVRSRSPTTPLARRWCAAPGRASSRRSSRPTRWSARIAVARCGSSRSSRSRASCEPYSSTCRCGLPRSRDRHLLLPADPWISSTSPARTEIFPQENEGGRPSSFHGRGSSSAQRHFSRGLEQDNHGLRQENAPHKD